jgi:hypothetical protein
MPQCMRVVARSGSEDDPRDEGCQMKAGMKTELRPRYGRDLSRVLDHVAPSGSTNAAPFICPPSSEQSRCSPKLVGGTLNRRRSSDHARTRIPLGRLVGL